MVKMDSKSFFEYESAKQWYQYHATNQDREKVRILYLSAFKNLDEYAAFVAAVAEVKNETPKTI